MARIDFALDSIRFARQYTHTLLDGLCNDSWYWMPDRGVTHICWQVGHITWAQHRLVFGRVVGRDSEFCPKLPEEYAELFGKGSTPKADTAIYPHLDQLRTDFDRVHESVQAALPTLPDALLSESSEPRHPAFTDKFGALLWSARHELVHAGQIALLRRLLGLPPLR